MEQQELSSPRDLHWSMWLGLPIVGLLVLWTVPLAGAEIWRRLIPREIGFLEIGTVALLVPAIVLAVLIFLRRRRLPRGIGWVMLLGGVAALYFLGEEISWGQTYLGWETPGAVAELNRQKETNLHNLRLAQYGAWGDVVEEILHHLPRRVMLLLCIIAGVVLPVALHRRLSTPAARKKVWYWLLPTWRLAPAALVATFSTVPEKLYKILVKSGTMPEWPRDGYAYMAFIDPAGEFKEYCFALVIFLYLLSVHLRARNVEVAGA